MANAKRTFGTLLTPFCQRMVSGTLPRLAAGESTFLSLYLRVVKFDKAFRRIVIVILIWISPMVKHVDFIR